MRRLRDARLYSATLTFTTMGGFLGLAMGLAGGLARRSVFASARAAILGALARHGRRGFAWLASSCRFSSRGTTRNRATWCSPCSLMVRSGRPWVLSAAWRSGWGSEVGPLESNPGRGARRCGRGDGRLRNCRGARLRVQQDGPPAVGLDHDTRDGPIAGRDPVGGRGGLGLESVREEQSLLVRAPPEAKRVGVGRASEPALARPRGHATNTKRPRRDLPTRP